MSGPVTTADCPDAAGSDEPEPPVVEVLAGRAAEVGGMPVTRVLPKRARRTVGAWCFVDHFGPADVGEAAMNVGPHPHIGLQTVTWLLDGEVVHDDSLEHEALLRPGGVNVMTSGDAIAHAERTTQENTGKLDGVQLWAALPDAHRRRPGSFQHVVEAPALPLAGGVARVFSGALGQVSSPAQHFSELVGADLEVGRASALTVPLQPAHEHGVLMLRGDCALEGQRRTPCGLGAGKRRRSARSGPPRRNGSCLPR